MLKSIWAHVKSERPGILIKLALIVIIGLQIALIFFAYNTKKVGDGQESYATTAEIQSTETPSNPIWSDWTVLWPCSVSCGEGIQVLRRSCGIRGRCAGDDVKVEICTKEECPVDGGWSIWKETGQCSVTCGLGSRREERTCTNPEASSGGAPCAGQNTRTVPCALQQCSTPPVDGGWTEWTSEVECSRTCGTDAVKIEFRTCSNPSPRNNGEDCSGERIRSTPCALTECEVPVNGSWSDWNIWMPCSISCGEGIEVRRRYCNDPPPSHNGQTCTGDDALVSPCYGDDCEGWTNWENASDCSVSCGKGAFVQERTCLLNTTDCHGRSVREMSCYWEPCPVNGNWSAWEVTSNCSVTCGGGELTEERFCNNPPPLHNGLNCSGASLRTVACNTHTCVPVDGGWSDWSLISACSVTCGGGVQMEERLCNNPAPKHGGSECEGNSTRLLQCNSQMCFNKTDLVLADASSACNASDSQSPEIYECAFPFMHNGREMRNCIFNESSKVAYCPMQVYVPSREPVEDQWGICDSAVCPIAGGWTDWEAWNLCSVSCGSGHFRSYRSCLNPPPLNGGEPCEGSNEMISICNDRECPSQPCTTIGGPVEGAQCILPFMDASGEHHNDCILDGREQPWCAAGQVTSEGQFMEGNWGFCDYANCPVEGGWMFMPRHRYCPCGTGEARMIQNQTCSNPPPINGGSICPPSEQRRRWVDCSVRDCFNTNCGGLLEDANGVITSSNYPEPYESLKFCVWNIRVARGLRIEIFLELAELEERYDFLRIENLEEGGVRSLTGNHYEMAFRSVDETATVIFESDHSHVQKGFLIRYYSVLI